MPELQRTDTGTTDTCIGAGADREPKQRSAHRHLFRDIIVPATLILHRLEMRGLPLDEVMRNKLRKEAKDRYDKACWKLRKATKEFHEKRCARLEAAIRSMESDRGSLRLSVTPEARCETHPRYVGLARKAGLEKCLGCKTIYNSTEEVRAVLKDLTKRLQKGKGKLKQIGEDFNPGSDDHWRELLFDPDIGYGYAVTGRTKVRKEGKVDDEAIAKLQVQHPENEILCLRVDIQQTETRLSTRLAVESDPDGRVRFPYSMSRTENGRISSGKDDEEVDKFRAAPGNAQNIPERDRKIYRAEEGKIFISVDWSQIEARAMAWFAREMRMLKAFAEGQDIHGINGAALAHALASLESDPARKKVLEEVTSCTSRSVTFWFQGEQRTFRYGAKRQTHGWDYGMLAKKTSELYGIPLPVAQRLLDAYFAQWPRLRPYQEEEVRWASKARKVHNAFGRILTIWNWKKDKRTWAWVAADREEILAFRPASSVGDMCKAVLPEMDQIATDCGGELLQTMHDSFLTMLTNDDMIIRRYVTLARRVMEQEWPQLGEVSPYGYFWCPADFEIGMNWGPHDPKDNPEGLEKYHDR